MAEPVYKSGQGYWTRTLTAIAAAVLVVGAVGWIWGELNGIGNDTVRLAAQSTMAVVMLGGFGALIYWLVGWHSRVVDFMIATEAEMRKVNWPTQREVIVATGVVIAGTLSMAAMLWVIDILLALFFQTIGVLRVSG